MLIPPSLICVLLWSVAMIYFDPKGSTGAIPAMLLAWALARVLFPRSAK